MAADPPRGGAGIELRADPERNQEDYRQGQSLPHFRLLYGWKAGGMSGLTSGKPRPARKPRAARPGRVAEHRL